MKDEIKEIDITKDLYLCSPLLNTECSKENCYINNGPCCHTVIKEHSQQHLLDYITNLQEENKRLKQNLSKGITNNLENKYLNNKLYKDLEDYKTRNDKAIEYIEYQISQLDFEKDIKAKMLGSMVLVLLQGKSDE